MHLNLSSAKVAAILFRGDELMCSQSLCKMGSIRGSTQTHTTLQWRHNGRDSVSNHQPHDCLLNRLFRRRSKKTSKLRVTGLCGGTGEFPAQMASNAENVSIWWRHHARAAMIPYPSKYDRGVWGCCVNSRFDLCSTFITAVLKATFFYSRSCCCEIPLLQAWN